ncbi:MAG: pyruvate kinase [Nanoarchaeota archaeon]|nr:pyruvate kinase [Nanoarchaeota archaeon]
MKKTKIICTIGPASLNSNTIKRMCNNGMNACRINTSYGDFKQYDEIIKNIRSSCNLPIMLDTEGPEIRVVNDDFKFSNEDVEIFLSVNIYKQLKPGLKIVLNDGLTTGKVVKVKSKSLIVRLYGSGQLVKNKSIVFKKTNIHLPILTRKDEEVLKYAVKKKADFISLSYTRSKEDVELVRKKLGKSGIKIIAKIENKEGSKKYKEIMRSADAVMIARGDLGVELPSEKIPLLQKQIINDCNTIGVPVIVATQMMESMISNTTPTRAETSDVANAILDGADAVMLSGETSIGSYPSLVVQKMNSICINTEKSEYKKLFESSGYNIVDAVTSNAFKLSEEMNARIICLTRSGYTARMLSRFKPERVLIAFTNNELIARQLMISYGIKPLYYKKLDKYDIKEATKLCLKKKLVKINDFVVFVAGLFIKNTTNTITIYNVKELIK